MSIIRDSIENSRQFQTEDYSDNTVLNKIKNVDGSGSGLDADLMDGVDSTDFVLVTDYEDTDVLTKIKNVDGSGSGLDADTLDGYDSTDFVLASASTPTSYDLISPLIKADSGVNHSVVVDSNGKVWTTGAAGSGQTAQGNTTTIYSFTDTGLTGVIEVAAGYAHTVALKSDGTVWTAGENSDGQLGLGDTTDRNVFTDTGLTNVIKIGRSNYGNSTYAIKSDGTLWVTGNNPYGQLGLDDTTDRNVFTNTGLTGVTSVHGGQYFAAIIKDGNVWTTGLNTNGQLGLGDTTARHVFTDTGVAADMLTCGYKNTYIIKDNVVFSTGAKESCIDIDDTDDSLSFKQSLNTAAIGITSSETTVFVLNAPYFRPPVFAGNSGGYFSTAGMDSLAVTGIYAGGLARAFFTTLGGSFYVAGRDAYGAMGIVNSPSAGKVYYIPEVTV